MRRRRAGSPACPERGSLRRLNCCRPFADIDTTASRRSCRLQPGMVRNTGEYRMDFPSACEPPNAECGSDKGQENRIGDANPERAVAVIAASVDDPAQCGLALLAHGDLNFRAPGAPAVAGDFHQ